MWEECLPEFLLAQSLVPILVIPRDKEGAVSEVRAAADGCQPCLQFRHGDQAILIHVEDVEGVYQIKVTHLSQRYLCHFQLCLQATLLFERVG